MKFLPAALQQQAIILDKADEMLRQSDELYIL